MVKKKRNIRETIIAERVKHRFRADDFYIPKSIWILAGIVFFAVAAYFFGPAITSFVTREYSYSQEANIVAAASGNYTLNLEKEGDLKSLRVSGSVTKTGTARVYLEGNGIRYLIFSNEMLDSKNDSSEDLTLITAFATKDGEDKKEDEKDSKDKDKEKPAKTIDAVLEYKKNTIYDENDDGIESIYKPADLSVEKTNFSWRADESGLCTRWEIYNIEDEKATTLCYGNGNCCSYIGLLPKRERWNETYYAVFGTEGAGYKNIISAQVIHAEYKNGTYENTVSSGWQNLSVDFYDEYSEFTGMCNETCSLNGLNKTSYLIVFEVENATLRIDEFLYVVSSFVSNKAPVLIKNFTNITLAFEDNFALNLSSYFYDEDSDALDYSSFAMPGIIITFENDLAIFSFEHGFNGTGTVYIIANDTTDSAVSNAFSVTVAETYKQQKKFFYIGNSTNVLIDDGGDMFISGNASYNLSELYPESGSFIVQNASGVALAYVSSNGSLFLKGDIFQSDGLNYTGQRLEIKDSNGNTIAMFDDMGNLRLKGNLSVNHFIENIY